MNRLARVLPSARDRSARSISIDAARLPDAVTPDEFYVRDLLGASVVVDGRAIGTVRDVINRPANDVLDVVGAEGASVLLPFTRDAVIAIDLAARRIELRAGLIDPLAGPDAGGGGGRDAG